MLKVGFFCKFWILTDILSVEWKCCNYSSNLVMLNKNTIGILFYQPEISIIFADLLDVLQINNQILSDETEIFENDYLITELKYFNLIKSNIGIKCIVVGDQLEQDSDAILLEQPLSQRKVLQAISLLINSETR